MAEPLWHPDREGDTVDWPDNPRLRRALNKVWDFIKSGAEGVVHGVDHGVSTIQDWWQNQKDEEIEWEEIRPQVERILNEMQEKGGTTNPSILDDAMDEPSPLTQAFDQNQAENLLGAPMGRASEVDSSMGDENIIEYESAEEMEREPRDIQPVHEEYIPGRRTQDDFSYDVQSAQRHLIDLGYDLGPDGADGIFGDKTKAALEQFYKDRGRNRDGTVIDEAFFTEAISARR